jgi:hypothetical protein
LSGYKVLVMPDAIPVSLELAAKIESYLATGRALIASFESGLNAEQTQFALQALGVQLTGEGPGDVQGSLVRGRPFPHNDYVEYVLPAGEIGRGLPETEHAMYMKGMDIEAAPGSQVLAYKVNSYFDRTTAASARPATPSSGQGAPPSYNAVGHLLRPSDFLSTTERAALVQGS